MRCFIAVELQPKFKHAIWEQTEPLRAFDADVRWVSEENYHLTLKFLGETPESKIDGIRRAITAAVKGIDDFDVSFRGCGAFPNNRDPHIIWVGLVGFGNLQTIFKKIEPPMSALGFKADDRVFHPHLTIGRVKSPKGIRSMTYDMANYKTADFGSSKVRAIALMKSELTPKGPIYTRLFEVPLRGLE